MTGHEDSEHAGPASASAPTTRQQSFLRYFTATLIDLVVLGLFAQFWGAVTVDTFSVALLAALMLQLMLKATLAFEHRVAARFEGKSGKGARAAHLASAWTILFASKLLMLWVLERVLGHQLAFHGVYHGVVPFIAVVVVMLVAEEAVVRIYRRLG